MKTFLRSLTFVFAVAPLCLATAYAAHPFFCTDSYSGKVARVEADGTVAWEFPCEHPQDCWVLANGDFLFCHKGGAIELSPERKTVWSYHAPADVEVHSCQPLPDGRVLLVENGRCRLVEVDRAGKVAKEIPLARPPSNVSIHDQFRGVRKTPAGHYLVCRKGEHRIDELDGEGKVLRSIPVGGDVHMARLLPDGHLLVATGEGRSVLEYDQAMHVVWKIEGDELPGNPLRLMTGFQRLPNGNTVICNYLGHGHVGEQPEFFEITRDKKIVWQFSDHTHFKTINQIQLLDVPGDPAAGAILR